jgi:hypothetical protein
MSNRSTNQLRNDDRIFQPETFLKWRHDLVWHKWTYKHQNKGDRPRIIDDRKDLIVRFR